MEQHSAYEGNQNKYKTNSITIRDELTVIELTCPYETSSVKQRKYIEN